MENKNFKQFCKDFNIVENALQMRQLIRWNGRDLVQRENLSEHTHLVAACVIHIVKELRGIYDIYVPDCVELTCMKAAMLHDSLELLRGDILSVTKKSIPGLKECIDAEEREFMATQLPELTELETEILELADLMACYKFLERELRYPNNDFCKQAYITCKQTFDTKYEEFLTKQLGKQVNETYEGNRFVKGYVDDAGVDIILTKDTVFLPMSTTNIDLEVTITPSLCQMAELRARTSAAAKGLIVASCPIDPNYSGSVSAIVHNISNQIIEYKAGEAFCQYITVEMIPQSAPAKKPGQRSKSKLGGTDK